ncbi:unnamed protein product [Leptosia nina]|uniref:Uncharacterized protein n=1 Tax=Leptosia nina TaxID=320188 RepID=A0AAV1K031_9NEOP
MTNLRKFKRIQIQQLANNRQHKLITIPSNFQAQQRITLSFESFSYEQIANKRTRLAHLDMEQSRNVITAAFTWLKQP